VWLERTDTAASGTYTWTTQGAIALNERGPAGFELGLPNTLGLTLPPVTAPVAAYVPALRTGPYVYVSGQVPVADGKLLGTGKVDMVTVAKQVAERLAAKAQAQSQAPSEPMARATG